MKRKDCSLCILCILRIALGLACGLAMGLRATPGHAQQRHAQQRHAQQTQQSPAAAELPDVAGTWAQMQVTSALSRVPILGEVSSRTVSYLLMEVRQDGRELVIDQKVCWIRIDSEVTKVRTVIPPAMTAAIGVQTRTGRIARVDDAWVFLQPQQWDVLGARLRVADERLPTDEDDPRLVDADADGKPGVTIRVVGIIDGEIYLVQRSWNALRGAIEADQVQGRVRWSTDQEVIDASSFLLDSNPKTRPDPAPEKSHFRMRRVPAGTDCETVIRDHASFLGD